MRRTRWSTLGASFALVQLIAACSGGGGNPIASAPSASTPGASATAPAITTQPMAQVLSAGQSATFTVTATGSAPLTYNWQRNGASIGGATASSYSTSPTTASDNGVVFTAVVSNSAGAATSTPATLTVNAAAVAPRITTQPSSATVIAGQPAAFTVVAAGTAPLSYQWNRNGSVIAGANAASYALPATSATDNGAAFNVVVKDAGGAVKSNNGVLTVTTSPLTISTAGLPNGVVAHAYSTVLRAGGGVGPYTWTLKSGQLPAGLALSAASGAIAGTPTTAETSAFGIYVHDGSGAVASHSSSITISDAPVVAPFKHIVIVLEENANYSAMAGSSTTMPYLHSLIGKYGLATQYFANTHPSIGNYEMLVTGQILTNDDSKTPASFPIAADNIVRELSANSKTWKAYAEDLPTAGYIGGNVGNYAVRHVPLAYLTDVKDSAAGRNGLVPFTQFSADLASGKLPNLSFLTPNLCNDAHNCSLSVADAWLKTHIEPLLTSAPFKDDGLLIIAFDESEGDNTHGGGHIAAVFVSPAFSKRGYQSKTVYQHESTLRLMLEGLGVRSLPGAAAKAPAMWEFFNFPTPP